MPPQRLLFLIILTLNTRTMNRLLFFTAWLLLFHGCATEHTSPVHEAKSAILEVLNNQVRAWNAGDIDGYMQGYWKSDSVRFVSGNGMTSGWNKTCDRYKKGYPDKASMGRLQFDHIEIDVLSDSAAVVLGTWQLHRAGDDPRGYFMLLMGRKQQGWCVVLDHTSSAGT